ncbi:preprotein translocase subunit SecE [Corynebacterium hansenii]|uniref:Protein translocase subunit SecE n=1 Tax=Corynebacterium hansenii TaxID=394964 RepID=A0ABV7ZM36_9CORY|nr:preprotein translocase subunit SecE [Corynebacterium hansenii]WJY98969.1 preprotein translocase subunit SecE [Corynebacterium hansenii]
MAEEKSTTAAARPTGKRQVSGAPATTARDSRPVKRNDDEKLGTRNPLTFIKQVISELRKVIWPTGRQMVVYTIVVLLFLVFMVTLVWGVDALAGLGVQSIFTR